MSKMLEFSMDGCCTKCRHSKAAPCPDMVACLTEGPICHEDQDCTDMMKKYAAVMRRDQLLRPVIFVGMGTCGIAAGAVETMKAAADYVKANNINADLVEIGCVGLCSAEPIVDVHIPGKDRVSFQKVTAENVGGILDGILKNDTILEDHVLGQYGNSWGNIQRIEDHQFFKSQMRFVLRHCGIIDPGNIDEYIARGGYRAISETIRNVTPDELCADIIESGLRGRGGGGFPTGRKWKFAQQTAADQKYLICNADEGDPGAFMDRAVIEGDPHRLLEGMALAAYAIGATKAYVYIRAEYPLAIKRLKVAIKQAEQYGFIGHNILDSGMNLEIFIKMGAGAFVCGEETALINSIEGKRGMPRPRPPFPAVAGLFGKPTVINNVETLANLPGIIAGGKEAFRQIGTETSKGTKVFALSGKVLRTGLVEVAMGTKIRDIIFEIGGGIANNKKYKAVQIGGPSGGCIPEQHLDIDIDYESLKKVGAMMGSGGLVVMDEDTCMVDVARFFMDFIQRESCGKCIPCREGTRRMLEILEGICRGRRDEEKNDSLERFQSVLYIQRLARTIKDTSLCGLGQTAPNPVLSTLNFFRHEYEEHIFERKCSAGVCTGLLTFSINEEQCTGCTACARKCPADAIKGAKKSPHYIIQNKCIRCGACLTACRFNAVIKE